MLESAEEKQPEQVLSEQVKHIAEENLNGCYNCKWLKLQVKNANCNRCKHNPYTIPNNYHDSYWKSKEKENEKNCDTCKKYNTYFDCSQCSDFDEWEEKRKPKGKMKIILISGHAMAGKDASANMLKSKLESQDKTVLIAHYGDLVKYTCKTFFNWNGEKDEQGRTLLQEVGTDKIREIYPNFWIAFMFQILQVFYNHWDYVIIPDARFPNEIDEAKLWFGSTVTSIRVVRTNYISTLTDEQRKHRSEIALDDYPFDYYMIADDLESLERKVDNLLKDL